MEIWDSDDCSIPSEYGTSILDLAGSLLARSWPPQRVLVGLMVCKYMRTELGQNVEFLELSRYCGRQKRRASADQIVMIHPRGYDVEKTLLHFESSNLRISFHTKRSNDDHYDTIMCGMIGAWKQGWRASLVELDVSSLWILDSGAEQIVTALEHSPAIRYLDMNQTHISGIDQISNALKGATELEHLDLGQNAIGNESATALGVLLLGKSKLEYLDMGSNFIESEGIRNLALSECSALEYLNLSANVFGPDGMRCIAEHLRRCSFLSVLHLNACELRDGGAEAVAGVLGDLRKLETLSLCHNAIHSQGARALAHGISRSTSLVTLDLGWNRIGDEGCVALAGKLTLNTPRLKSVGLSNNWIGDAGAAAVAQALHQLQPCPSAFCEPGAMLDLSANRISPEGGEALVQAVRACSEHLSVLWS